MGTLRDRVGERDRERFVGRAAELAWFERLRAGELPYRVVHVTGPAGIGKSALLRELARRSGLRTVWLEGRDLPPFPEDIDARLRDVGGEPAVVVIDSYELVSSLDGHLRELVIPDLPASTIVLIGSRTRPARGWFEHGWDTLVHELRLDGMARDELVELAGRLGADEALAGELVRTSRGSPLAVVLGASTGASGSLAEVADRLLGAELERDRYAVLGVAALARITTPDLLAAVLPDRDHDDDFKWLADRSFCEPIAVGVTMHALVAQAVRDSLRERDPLGEAALRRGIADHLYRRAVAGRYSLSTDLQHLVVDQQVRWGFSVDVGSRYHIDSIRPGDLDRIGAVFHAVERDDWWAASRALIAAHPRLAGVARDRDGTVGGYFVAVGPLDAPPEADADPILGPWLHHARTVLRTGSAVLWREAIDLTGEMGEVTSLLGAAGVLNTGVGNPRYGFLPISPDLPAARAFSEALGATHVAELDVTAFGEELECHVIDFGPRGVLGFQRDWIHRETGAAPPADHDERDPQRLLRLLRDPDRLVDGPAWLGDRPSVRLAALRALVTEALGAFGDSRDDRLAHSIARAAYLEDAAPHEAIARRFHLSRSAYFRRLQAVTARLADELGARIPT